MLCLLFSDVFSPAVTTGQYRRFSLWYSSYSAVLGCTGWVERLAFFPNQVGIWWYPDVSCMSALLLAQTCHELTVWMDLQKVRKQEATRQILPAFLKPLFQSNVCVFNSTKTSDFWKTARVLFLPWGAASQLQSLSDWHGQSEGPPAQWRGADIFMVSMLQCQSCYMMLHDVNHILSLSISWPCLNLPRRRTIPCWAVYSPCWHWTGQRVSRPVKAAGTRRKEHRRSQEYVQLTYLTLG